MGGVVSCSVGNRYRKTIWVKYDVEKKYVQMKEYGIEGQVGFAGIEVGAGLTLSKTYDWTKIETNFTPVKPMDFKELAIDTKDSKVMYVTIITEDEEVIVNSWPSDVKNLVVTNDAKLRQGDENNPLKVHKRYQKFDFTMSEKTENLIKTAKVNLGGNPNENPAKKIADDLKDTRTNTESIKRSENKDRIKDNVDGLSPKSRPPDVEYGKASDEYRTNNDESAKASSAREQQTRNERRCISNISAEKSASIFIKDNGDSNKCFITGVDVTDNGTIFLADRYNNNIKCVSEDNKIVSVLTLPASPTAITVLDATTAVVSANDKKLYNIDVTENIKLSLKGQSLLDYTIFAMTNYNGNLVILCDTVCTKMITRKGVELWSVNKNRSGQKLFSFPRGILATTIDNTAVIVVTDRGENTLTLLEADTGSLIVTINVGEKWPWGITADSDGNTYVCYSVTNEIGVWSNHLTESTILLSKDQLGRGPGCIVYSSKNDSLYVLYFGNDDKMDCFRLQ